MRLVLRSLREPLVSAAGTAYRARICGRNRDDGFWEGWIEFDPDDGGAVLRTERETTQPNRAALEYWASGLTPVYLDGALTRAMDALRRVELQTEPPEVPAYEGPATPLTTLPAGTAGTTDDPVLDPFSVYALGEDVLRAQLNPLSRRHLLGIIETYRLASPAEIAVAGGGVSLSSQAWRPAGASTPAGRPSRPVLRCARRTAGTIPGVPNGAFEPIPGPRLARLPVAAHVRLHRVPIPPVARVLG
jgi:hypothetical protein